MDNVTGKRFEKLVIISEIPKDERKVSNFCEYLCKCDCGRIVRVRRNNILNGKTKSCGCLKKETVEKTNSKHNGNIIGQRFGRLFVESEVPRSEWRNKTKREYLCKCDCGNVVRAKANALKNGNTKSCGCLFSDFSKNQGEDITGKVFGELTAIRRVESCVYESGRRSTRWLFRCSCGKELVIRLCNVKNGVTKSCGHMGKSLAEYEMSKWLSEHNIRFDIQATFRDLKNPNTNYRLKYDFKIYRNDDTFFVVEHQGVQHFRDCKDGFGKLQREQTDKMKKDYCKAKEITLYETRYDEDYIAKLSEIIKKELGLEGVAYVEGVKCG